MPWLTSLSSSPHYRPQLAEARLALHVPGTLRKSSWLSALGQVPRIVFNLSHLLPLSPPQVSTKSCANPPPRSHSSQVTLPDNENMANTSGTHRAGLEGTFGGCSPSTELWSLSKGMHGAAAVPYIPHTTRTPFLLSRTQDPLHR